MADKWNNRIDQLHIDAISKNEKDSEILKVIKGYLIDGSASSVSERICIDDELYYEGRVDGMREAFTINQKITSVIDAAKMCTEKGIASTIENGVVTVITVKRKEGNYESHQMKISIKSFKEIVETSQQILQKNMQSDKSIIENINDSIAKYDEGSDEEKCLIEYKKFFDDSIIFTFILLKYDTNIGEIKNTIRTWHIYDVNDVVLRATNDINKEFNI